MKVEVKANQTLRIVVLLAALLLTTSCGSLGSASREEPFLSVRFFAENDKDLGALVYASGRMMYEEGSYRWARKADAALLGEMNALARDPGFRRILLRIRAVQDPELLEDLSFVFRIETEDGVLFTRCPFDQIPEDLRPHLKQIDDAFTKVYGKKYGYLLASIRPATP